MPGHTWDLDTLAEYIVGCLFVNSRAAIRPRRTGVWQPARIEDDTPQDWSKGRWSECTGDYVQLDWRFDRRISLVATISVCDLATTIFRDLTNLVGREKFSPPMGHSQLFVRSPGSGPLSISSVSMALCYLVWKPTVKITRCSSRYE